MLIFPKALRQLEKSDSITCTTLPNREWGICYVLMGSTWGGKVLSAHLSKYSVPSVRENMRFLYGFGENTGKVWEKFCEKLNSLKFDEELIISSAKLAFEVIEQHLLLQGRKILEIENAMITKRAGCS